MKKSKLYTRTGDNATTSLCTGNRVPKNHIRIEAYGTIDELNSHLGLLAAILSPKQAAILNPTLTFIQNKLFDLGAHLATDPLAARPEWQLPQPPTDSDILRLETQTDIIDSQLPPLNNFVIPGGTKAAAQAHIARTVARRAERRITDLHHQSPLHPNILQFINRLSDLLFAAARFCNISAGQNEIFWNKDC